MLDFHLNHIAENVLHWYCTIHIITCMSYTDTGHVLYTFLLRHLRVAGDV